MTLATSTLIIGTVRIATSERKTAGALLLPAAKP
jgi:hypothetical protein